MAIVHDADASSFTNGFNAVPGTIAFNHTCTGSNLILWLAVQIFQDVSGVGSVVSATYNGVAMTKYVDHLATGTTMYTALYYLIGPSTGTNSLSVLFTGAVDDIGMQSSSYTGVDQTTGVDASGTGEGFGTTATATFSSMADNCEFIDSMIHFGTGAITKGANQTLVNRNNATSTSKGSSFLTTPKTPAGSVSMSWTWTGSGDWSISAASFKPAGGAASALYNQRRMKMGVG